MRIALHHVGPIWQQTGYASGNRMWPARLRIQTGLWLPRCPATSSPQRRCSTSRYPQYPPGPTLQNTLLLILTGHVSYAEELEDCRLSSYQTCIALSKLSLPARTPRIPLSSPRKPITSVRSEPALHLSVRQISTPGVAIIPPAYARHCRCMESATDNLLRLALSLTYLPSSFSVQPHWRL